MARAGGIFGDPEGERADEEPARRQVAPPDRYGRRQRAQRRHGHQDDTPTGRLLDQAVERQGNGHRRSSTRRRWRPQSGSPTRRPPLTLRRRGPGRARRGSPDPSARASRPARRPTRRPRPTTRRPRPLATRSTHAQPRPERSPRPWTSGHATRPPRDRGRLRGSPGRHRKSSRAHRALELGLNPSGYSLPTDQTATAGLLVWASKLTPARPITSGLASVFWFVGLSGFAGL